VTHEPRIDEIEDRQMQELLGELRLAFPGTQILLAFLLTVPFQPAFERLNSGQRTLYYVTLLLTAASAVCFLGPTAYHRLRFHKGDRPWIIERAHRLTVGGLVFLGAAIAGALALVTDFLYDGAIVWILVAVTCAAIVTVWFAAPLLRHRRAPDRSSSEGDA
jgi:hypothetical protein